MWAQAAACTAVPSSFDQKAIPISRVSNAKIRVPVHIWSNDFPLGEVTMCAQCPTRRRYVEFVKQWDQLNTSNGPSHGIFNRHSSPLIELGIKWALKFGISEPFTQVTKLMNQLIPQKMPQYASCHLPPPKHSSICIVLPLNLFRERWVAIISYKNSTC